MLKKMYKLLCSSPLEDREAYDNDDEDTSSDLSEPPGTHMPPKWSFLGWMPFRLFGPRPLSGDVSTCLRLFEVGGDLTILDKQNVDPKIK
jgi:hypothetical protein